MIFASTAHGLTSLDPATGELLWEIDSIFRQRCVASPVVANGVVLAVAGQGKSELRTWLPMLKGLAAQLPAGAILDLEEARRFLRRALVAAALIGALGIGYLALEFVPSLLEPAPLQASPLLGGKK